MDREQLRRLLFLSLAKACFWMADQRPLTRGGIIAASVVILTALSINAFRATDPANASRPDDVAIITKVEPKVAAATQSPPPKDKPTAQKVQPKQKEAASESNTAEKTPAHTPPEKSNDEPTPSLASIMDKLAELGQPVMISSDATSEASVTNAETSTLPPIPNSKPEPLSREITLAEGDTVLSILLQHGVNDKAAYQALEKAQELVDLRRMRPGKQLTLEMQQAGNDSEKMHLAALTIHHSPSEKIVIAANGNGYSAEKVDVPLKRELVHIGAQIEHSFLGAGLKAGIPSNVMMEMIQQLSYEIDFQRGIYPDDEFYLLFERFYDEKGQHAYDGKVIYAGLNSRGETIEVYRFDDGKKGERFYHADGRSLRKGLMRTPVDGARLSSGFGMRRHPVLGYTKMHKGVDFAAPTGTPIFAAGDGTIEYIGRYGSYGNYIRIRHNGGLKTAYAHLHRFSKGLKRGAKVKQGQVIAQVGTTGRSTGPHLHFEVLKGGKQINPQKVKLLPREKLGGTRLAKFKAQKGEIKALLASLPRETKLAGLE